MNSRYIIWFKDLGIEDVPKVGGKNAALGEMFSNLIRIGINVPDGFAVTADAYRYFAKTGAQKRIGDIVKIWTYQISANFKKAGKEIRNIILNSEIPEDLVEEIAGSYSELEKEYGVKIWMWQSARRLPLKIWRGFFCRSG